MKGFSLIEMLVSLAIMVLVFGIVYPRYRDMGDKSALLSASYEMSQRLREAQELALSSEKVGEGLSAEVPDGYGLYLDLGTPDRYIIYSDLNNNQEFDEGEAVGDPVEFGENVVLDSMEGYETASVNFSPPAPETTITVDSAQNLSSVGIVISIRELERSVIVNKAGLIYVE